MLLQMKMEWIWVTGLFILWTKLEIIISQEKKAKENNKIVIVTDPYWQIHISMDIQGKTLSRFCYNINFQFFFANIVENFCCKYDSLFI